MSAPRILVVDDERRMCESLKMLLEGEGYEIATAGSFQEGIACLEKCSYDLVITDLILHELSGFEIMDYVAANSRETLVIAMTGHATLDSAVEAMRRGAYDYVIKPFNFEVMRLTVSRALDRIRLSRRIKQSEEKYKLLVEEINDGYFVLQDRRLVYLNKTFANMLGYASDELMGRDFSVLLEMECYPKLERIVLNASDASGQEEFCLKTKDGTEVPAEIRITRAYIDDQLSFIGICRDISERKALWEKLLRSEKLASLGSLVAGIAHELNNKLTPILAYSELMEDSNLTPKDRRRLEVIAKSAESAKKIIQSLLLFTRQEKPHKEYIDVNEVINQALNLLRYQFDKDNIRLEVDLSPTLPNLFADFHQMEQVFFNIAKNAFEAIEDSGGELRVRSYRKEGDAIIEFTDTGAGIRPEHLRVVFDPFFTTKAEGKGTGLGLSLCHGIVQEHGGEINLTSIPGNTTFHVRLPLGVPVPLSADGQNLSDKGHLGDSRKAILVIDDEQSIALLLGELLENKYEVARMSNGVEALEAMAGREFDLIISDIKMPGMDGMEFFKWIETNKPSYKGKIVFTTGVVFDPKVQAFLQRANAPYLTKPFKVAKLLETVETVLGKDNP